MTGVSQASFFSFASDSNNTLPTFKGTGASGSSFTLNDAGASNQFKLLIDDNNGPLSAVALQSRFEADMRMQWAATTTLAGSTVLHSYNVSNGSNGFAFRFLDLSGAELLRASIDGPSMGVFSVVGTNSSWSTTGGLTASDTFASVTWTATQALVNMMTAMGVNPSDYGIAAGSSVAIDDFAFDLTRLVSAAGGSVALSDRKLPTGNFWTSEGSFSGSATAGIPTPGAVTLLAIGGLVAARRRRA